MTKVAIKNENITSFGGIYHIMDIFQSCALKNLPNLYWVNVEVAAKHSVIEVFFCGFSYFPIGLGGGFHDYARTKNPCKSPYQWI